MRRLSALLSAAILLFSLGGLAAGAARAGQTLLPVGKDSSAGGPHSPRVSAKERHLQIPSTITRLTAATAGSRQQPRATQAPGRPVNAAFTANITVRYTGFPVDAKGAFQAAVDIWKQNVVSAAPILIDANWSDLGNPLILASSGPADYVSNFSAAPQPNTFYPVALANAISGIDQEPANGPDNALGNAIGAEIQASFNSAPAADWYTGTDGLPAGGQLDLETVVLHELGHGLGFLGSYDGLDQSQQQDLGLGYYGLSYDGHNTTIFDKFVSDIHGTPLTAPAYPNASRALGRVLRGGIDGARWNGAWGIRAVGMIRPSLFSPTTWQPGSSFSHLDDNVYPSNSVNALMTSGVAPGETEHLPGPLMLGMFRDMGWPQPCTSTVAPGSPTDTFHPVAPLRIYSSVGYAGHPVDVPATGLAGVPTNGTVDAVAVNVEVYRPDTTGYIQVVPGCSAFSSAGPSTQQVEAGRTRLQMAVVRVDREGGIRIWVAHGAAILNVDIAGWFGAASGDRYHPLATRFLLPGGVTVKAGVPVDQQVLGWAGIPASGVDAVVLKASVTKPTASGWLTVSPGGVNTATATSAFAANQRISNLVMVKPGTGGGAGKLRLRVTAGSANVAFEVVGWYGAPGSSSGLVFHPGSGPVRVLNGPRVSTATVSGLPASTPVLLNVAVGSPSATGWVGVGPAGASVLRGTQEYDAGHSISGLMAADTNTSGQVRVRTSVGIATLYADRLGWFASS